MRRIKHFFNVVGDIPKIMRGEYQKTLAENGNPENQYKAAKYILQKDSWYLEDGEKDDAIRLLESAASKGHVEAQYEFSKYTNANKRIFWLQRAAENDHIEACYKLGQIYGDTTYRRVNEVLDGDNSELPNIDNEKALNYFKKAARKGHIEAHIEIALIYLNRKDIYQAIDWLRKAANSNSADAQFLLGTIFSNKNAPVKNAHTALYWFERAADNNHSGAQLELAKILLDTEKEQKAVSLLEKAAESGVIPAQYLLGKVLLESKDIKIRNREKAIYWLEQAARYGDETAKDLLSKIQN